MVGQYVGIRSSITAVSRSQLLLQLLCNQQALPVNVTDDQRAVRRPRPRHSSTSGHWLRAPAVVTEVRRRVDVASPGRHASAAHGPSLDRLRRQIVDVDSRHVVVLGVPVQRRIATGRVWPHRLGPRSVHAARQRRQRPVDHTSAAAASSTVDVDVVRVDRGSSRRQELGGYGGRLSCHRPLKSLLPASLTVLALVITSTNIPHTAISRAVLTEFACVRIHW